MKKFLLGLFFGIVAGILDVIPMILQNLTWDANISAFSMWVVIGIFISFSDIKIPSFLKGIIISFMVLIPSLVLIIWNNIFNIIPIGIMTLILGSLLGIVVEFTKKKFNI